MSLLIAGVRKNAIDRCDYDAFTWLRSSTSTSTSTMTYKSLWSAACSLAAGLQYAISSSSSSSRTSCITSSSNDEHSVVGVMIDSLPLLPVLELAILLAGMVVLPMDVDGVTDRHRHVLSTIRPKLLIISDDSHVDDDVYTLYCDMVMSVTELRRYCPVGNVSTNRAIDMIENGLDNIMDDIPSHVFFTSGSTGRPKGCKVSRCSLLEYVIAKNVSHNITSHSRVLVVSAPTFDPHIGDVMATWYTGGVLCCTQKHAWFTGLADCLQRFNVTHILTTPSLLSTVGEDAVHSVLSLNTLQVVALGGETMSTSLMNLWSGHSLKLANTYGVTECMGYQTFGIMSAGSSVMWIGNEMGKNVILLADRSNRGDASSYDGSLVLVKSGDVGEICIAGPQVGLGYWEDEDNTRLSFASYDNIGRVYHTGDLARELSGDETGDRGRLSNGYLFVGRMDMQLKVRGHRVEPCEIESAIVTLFPDLVHEAVVVVTKNADASNERLVAWCTPATSSLSKRIGISTFKQSDEYPNYLDATRRRNIISSVLCGHILPTRLPPHMVPSLFLWLPEMPLTLTKKLDRVALSKRRLVSSLTPCHRVRQGSSENLFLEADDEEDAIDSMDSFENAIALIWASELGDVNIDDITRESHFMHLGGDSLVALRVCRHIAGLNEKVSNISLPASGGTFGEHLGPLVPAELLRRPVLADFTAYLRLNSVFLGTDTVSSSILPRPPPPSVLLSAASVGLQEVVSLLLAHNIGSSINSNVDGRRTPLHAACRRGYIDTARMLLSAGASARPVHRPSGRTALHDLCCSGMIGAAGLVTDLIIVGGASPVALDNNRMTALHHAARTNAPLSVFDALLNADKSIATANMRKKGHCNGSNKRLNVKSSVNTINLTSTVDVWGRTPLHWAVVNGHSGPVQKLIEADTTPIRILDANGEMPLEIAERRAQCGAQDRPDGVRQSVFSSIAKLLGGSGATLRGTAKKEKQLQQKLQ